MDGPGHLLSLKVMRVSRPALATAWEPFYSSSPSFSARSTASVLSLQGKAPLSRHPKTLRDLTNASELLTLPASFGAIQLGETFSGVLAVNNETSATVDGVHLRVEMQTASNKVTLVELGGPFQSLAASDTLEAAVDHEIKEPGQHVLACIVTYKYPPGSKPSSSSIDGEDTNTQTFRKFYKFTISNPLTVKTKVHVPKSPSGLLSRKERDKVFLEVHIQNMTSEPMSFERISLDPAPGWAVEDINFSPGSSEAKESLFSGPMSMMLPQDARQYLYVLTASNPPEFAVQPAPGAVIPLGRLDLSWRSSFGEPGRLLTSMLSRRIPLIAPAQATTPRHQSVSALPPHIQRSQGAVSQPPSRPSTPQMSVPAVPIPYRPASPRTRPASVASAVPTPVRLFQSPPPPPVLPPEPLDIDLIAVDVPRGPVTAGVPLRLKFSLGLSVTVPEGCYRIISLAVQYIEPERAPSHTSLSTVGARVTRGSTAYPTPGSASSLQPARVVSPAANLIRDKPTDSSRSHLVEASDTLKDLPRPASTPGDEEKYQRTTGGYFVGASFQSLPPFVLEGRGVPVFTEFEMTWVPVQRGFLSIGGVRAIAVEDSTTEVEGVITDAVGPPRPPRVLKEWDVVGEIWVS